MTYPVSDHYDGAHFFNPEPPDRVPAPNGRRFGLVSFVWRRFVRGRMPEGWSTWPKRVANLAYPLPAAGPGDVAVTFVGHAGFLLRVAGLNVLTDPVFAERASPVQWAGPRRVRAPGVTLAALPPIDILLLSHNHYDHLDVAGLRALRRRFPAMAIVTGLGNQAFLARKGIGGAVELDWWQAAAVGDAKVTAVPARHFSARTLWDRNRTLWCGLLLEAGGRKIYFAGDTGYTRDFAEIRRRLGRPDVALLPIGAYEPRWIMGTVHMNPAEAVRAFGDLGATRAVGMHFGMFQLTAEAIDAPPRELTRALDAAGVAAERFVALDVGETVVYGAGNFARQD